MKNLKISVAVLTALFWCSSAAHSQDSDSLGVIGDNLDLYAVLDAFKNAENLEAFEKTINDQSNKINNLDLNEDGDVDYIQVHDEGEKDAHAIILRVAMGAGEDESQDVAVIELEKSADANATVQIVGDEELYGEDYIVEPMEDEAITKRLMIPNLIVINVWGWRSVRWIYGPTYVRWRSPYRWGVHPKWWKPWKPYKWKVYNGFHKHHHKRFHHVKVRRCVVAHGHYKKKRKVNAKIKQHHKHHSQHGHHNNHNGHKNHSGHKQAGHKEAGHKEAGHKDHKDGNNKDGGQVKKGNNQKQHKGGSHKTSGGAKKSGGEKKSGGGAKKSGGQKKHSGGAKKSGGQKKSSGGSTKSKRG